MSYPRVVQFLIVEDNVKAKEIYEEFLKNLRETYSIATACYAFSYEEAIQHLESDTLFHAVILDLVLPPRQGLPETIDLGFELLSKFATREHAPVPVLFVVSGNIAKADQDLLRQSRADFYKGDYFTKPSDPGKLNVWLQEAIEFANRYCEIGVHVRDSGHGRFPTLSPREDDLLRRFATAVNAKGLDLEWWSAEYIHITGQQGVSEGWTKTLFGHFLLADGASRPCFFKLLSGKEAGYVFAAAQNMGSKLSHIKVVYSKSSGERGLLVTEKVGALNARPKPLDSFLHPGAENIGADMPLIAADIAQQVFSLGQRTSQTAPLGKLLWRDHNIDTIAKAWNRFGGLSLLHLDDDDPIQFFRQLTSSTTIVRFIQQAFLHGDLNTSNVALDMGGERTQAFIFDAAGTAPDVNIRDFAAMEVSAILHHPAGMADNAIIEACSFLYKNEFAPAVREISSETFIANITSLILSIRKIPEISQMPALYSFLVFDYVLLQLGGIEITLSANKIGNPVDALRLLILVGNWCRQMFAQTMIEI